MEDYNRVLEATSVAENANGVAAEKMTVYNESLEAAQNRLTASVQQFAQDSNLDRTLALAYDGLSKVVEILNILLNKIPVLSPLIKALGVALAAAFIKSTIEKAKETGNVIDNLIKLLTGTQQQVKATTGLIPALFAAFTGLTGVINGTTTASAALNAVWTAMGGGVGVALAAIGALVALLPTAVKWFNDFKNAKENALKQSTQELETANQNLEDTNSQIKDIQDKINEINNKDGMTLTDQAEKERLEEELDTLKQIKQVQEDIAASKKSETLQDTKDVVTEKYGGEDKSVDEYLSGLKQNTAGWENLTMSGSLDSINTASDSINELAANVKYLDEQKKELSATDSDYQEKLDAINQKEQENTQQLLSKKQELLEYKQQLIDLGDTSSDEYQLVSKRINEITVALDPSKFPKLSVKDMIDTDGSEDKIKAAISKGGSSGFKELKGYADKFAQDILSDKITEAQWKEALGIPSTDSLGVNELSAEILNIFQQMFNDISDSSSTATEGFKNQQEAIEAYRQAEDNLAQQTDILTVAYSEMNNQGHLNSSTVTALKKQYPELTDALITQNGQVVINTDTLQNLTNSIYDNEIASITAERNKTLETINQTRQRIAAYNAEITALERLVKAGDETAEFDQNIAYQHKEDAINQLNDAKKAVEEANAEIDKLNAQRAKGLQNNGISGVPKSSGKSGSSGTSDADKAQKAFENEIKGYMKNLKGVITTYSANGFGAWDSQEAIDEASKEYGKFLDKVLESAESRKVTAEQLGINIDGKSAEEQIQMIAAVIKEQYGTIEEAYQKLAETAAKKEKELSEAREKEYEEAVKNIQELQKLTVNMIETAIDLLEKAGDIVFSLIGKISKKYDKQIDALDKQMDNLDKIGDYLDKQKDAFDDKIDAQKEMLKLQKEEMDNADELAEKNKSIADIDAQLMELQYDDSAEAQAKRLKLLDERAQKEKDLSDYQKDQSYDTKVDALDREKDAYDKNIEAQKKYIEAQKEALKEQQDAIKAAQDKFEQNLSKAQNVFNGFIKIISSDIFKKLAANVLDSLDGETLKKVLTSWNTWFGDGLKSTVENAWNNVYDYVKNKGWKKGDWLPDFSNIFQRGQQTEQNIQKAISDALGSGKIDFSSLKKTVDSMQGSFDNLTQKMLQSITNVDGKTGNVIQRITSLDKNALDTVANSGNGIISRIAAGIQQISQNGISSILNIGNTGNGVLATLGQKIQGILSNLVNLPGIAGKVATTIGGLAQKVGGLLGIGVSAAGGAGLASIGSTLASVGSALTPVAAAGAVIGAGAISGVESAKKIKGIWQSNDSVLKKVGKTALETINAVNPFTMIMRVGKKLFGKHHSGADYVKKQNPMLDKLLGLGNDETVSILKVGEAIVPKWANSANSSSSNTKYTGSSVSSAIATAIKSASAMLRGGTTSNTTDSSISISMPITIQGDASEATVAAFKKATNDIVNTVLRTINNQTRMGGYRNIKAATV